MCHLNPPSFPLLFGRRIAAGLCAFFFCLAAADAQKVIFEQSFDALGKGASLAGQAGWRPNKEGTFSPVLGEFLGVPALVANPDAAESVPVAFLDLPTAFRWQAGTEFILEFEAAIEKSDNSAGTAAAVGIGWTGGGIPPHVGISEDRYFTRQRHYGETFYVAGSESGFLKPTSGKWIRVRAVFRKDADSEAPVVSLSVQPMDSSEPEIEALFPSSGSRLSAVPLGKNADAEKFDYVNLVWVRVQKAAGIRNVRLSMQ